MVNTVYCLAYLIDNSIDSSGIYKICVPLVFVVATSGVGTVSIVHDPIHDYFQLLVSGRVVEPARHCFLVELLEAFHLAVRHHDDRVHDFLFVLSQELEAEEKK